MNKTSPHLDDEQIERLARLAREEGKSQAQILRDAIAAYQPAVTPADRNFALAVGFRRIDDDPRPISQIAVEDDVRLFGV